MSGFFILEIFGLHVGALAAIWLAVFPGAAIFVTVTIFNLIGDGLGEAMGER